MEYLVIIFAVAVAGLENCYLVYLLNKRDKKIKDLLDEKGENNDC